MNDWFVTVEDDTQDSLTIISSPVWEWNVFGGNLLVVMTSINVPVWRRILTTIFLGSTWKKL